MEREETETMGEKIAVDIYVAATQFCTFMEHIENFEVAQILDYMLKIMPLLYIKGGLLEMEDIEDTSACEQYVTEEDYELLYLATKRKLEEIDYFEYYNSYVGEVQSASLSEYMADVYQDLKDFVLLYVKNTITAQKAAAYLCSMHFEQGWGLKILTILPYVHSIVHKDNSESDMY